MLADEVNRCVVQIWSRNRMFDRSKFSRSVALMIRWRIISRSTGPSGDGHSLKGHVIVGA